jgi:hypothetical protein
MTRSKDLRAIGQCLETTRIDAFELENQAGSYLIRSQSITPTSHWIIKNSFLEVLSDEGGSDQANNPFRGGEGWLQYESRILSRLDAHGQKKRRGYLPSHAQPAGKPSQYLRTLGEHLDRVGVSAFTISWHHPYSVTVSYKSSDGRSEQRTFSFDKLHELGFHMRFRRARQNG